jgi:hypothetical protein
LFADNGLGRKSKVIGGSPTQVPNGTLFLTVADGNLMAIYERITNNAKPNVH